LSKQEHGTSASEEENLEKQNAEPSDWLSEGAHQKDESKAVNNTHCNRNEA
jgi:hypothetical protein